MPNGSLPVACGVDDFRVGVFFNVKRHYWGGGPCEVITKHQMRFV